MCGNYTEAMVEQQIAEVVVGVLRAIGVLHAIGPFILIILPEFCQEPQWFGDTLKSEKYWHLASVHLPNTSPDTLTPSGHLQEMFLFPTTRAP